MMGNVSEGRTKAREERELIRFDCLSIVLVKPKDQGLHIFLRVLKGLAP